MITVFILISLLFKTSLQADVPTSSANIINNLKQKSFVCITLNSISVIKCTGKISSYPKRITYFFSDYISSVEQFNLHLHGWLLQYRAKLLSEEMNYLNDLNVLPYALHTSQNHNQILIVPESSDKEKTFIEFFNNINNFELFFQQTSQLISNFKFSFPKNGIEVSAHSGAYVPLGIIANHAISATTNAYLNLIHSIKMFDATYDDPNANSYSNKIFNWLKFNNKNKLIIHYLPNSSTQVGALAFNDLAQRNNLIKQISINTYTEKEQDASVYDILPKIYRKKHFYILFDRF